MLDKKGTMIIERMIDMDKQRLMGFTWFILSIIPKDMRDFIINDELENKEFMDYAAKRIDKEFSSDNSQLLNELLWEAKFQ